MQPRLFFRQSAFTLVEIMIVVAIIGLLAAIAIPNFVRARERAQTNACINNLRLIDAAKQQWALEMRMPSSSEPGEDDLMPYLVRGDTERVPVCPSGGTDATFVDSYTINNVVTAPTCLIVPGTHLLPL